MALTVLRAALFVAGAAVVVGTAMSAVQTFVVPRAAPVAITRVVFLLSRSLFGLAMWRKRDYESRDRVMALFAPLTLLVLPGVWLTLIVTGYTAMFSALGATARAAFDGSVSSVLTMGFARPHGLPGTALSLSEGALGLGLVAMLITYLPTIYAAFSRRETAVALLDVRAGMPPSAVELIWRFHAIHGLASIDEIWPDWEEWFADMEESHTSLAALPHFRSPRAGRSWVTAAGAVLDAAALRASSLDMPRSPGAELCVRSGFLALRHISDFFAIAYDPDPAPDDPISLTREEFDAAWARLAEAGVPLKADRDQAWRDFAGWRVNYDTVLLALAGLTMAPVAPWSSDRALPFRRPPLTRRRGRRP